MVCKNCGSEMSEKDLFCKNCGKTVGKEKKTFTLSIPEEKLEDIKTAEKKSLVKDIVSHSENKTEVLTEPEIEKNETAAEEKADDSEIIVNTEASAEAEDENTEVEDKAEKTENEGSEPEAVEEPNGSEEKALSREEQIKEEFNEKEKLRRSSEKAAERKAEILKEKQKKQVKNADTFIKAIMSVCAVLIVALTFVSGFTGVFRDDGQEKTVVLSILLSQDSDLFEETIVKYAALFEEGYNCEEKNSDDMLIMMRPQSEGGLYAALNKTVKAETTVPDPAGRYEVATAALSKGYCKVPEKNIAKVLSSLSLENLKDVNCEDYYYYDGYYYFKAEEETLKRQQFNAEVVSAKKTSEGNYYIVCDMTSYSSQKDEYVFKKYFLATLNETEEGKSWSIRKISSEPMYDDFGNPVKKDDTKESLSYVMERHIIDAVTDSGKVYAKYVVEYPHFDTQGVAESAINSIYAQKIEEFETAAQKATKRYKSYIKKGGDKAALPLYTVVSASVKFNDKGYFSLVEKTTKYNPLSQVQVEETTTSANYYTSVTENVQTEEPVVVFPVTTIESYTFDISSGEFVKKDEVTGKDYLAVQQLLYKIWSGADTEDETAAVYDRDGIGAKIYASPWSLCKDGLMFTYTNDKGYTEEITIPYEKLPDRTVMK